MMMMMMIKMNKISQFRQELVCLLTDNDDQQDTAPKLG
jgi:hypothetical protein